MRIYVASSWRNPHQPAVVKALHAVGGFDVYDFRNPAPGKHGFAWSDIDPNWQQWTPKQFRKALKHPIAQAGFTSDMDALRGCDACICVLPCGRSAHLELGWAAGAARPTAILMLEQQEPELMYAMLGDVLLSIEDTVKWATRVREDWYPF